MRPSVPKMRASWGVFVAIAQDKRDNAPLGWSNVIADCSSTPVFRLPLGRQPGLGCQISLTTGR